MQEVCSSLDVQLGSQIKSESPINSLQQQSLQQKLVNNCDKRIDTSAYWMGGGGGVAGNGNAGNGIAVGQTEGFINSQPSMAEFMTHLDPDSPKMVGNQSYGVVTGDQMDGVPEYPWMKEKKTARKNSNQGKYRKFIKIIVLFFVLLFTNYVWQKTITYVIHKMNQMNLLEISLIITLAPIIKCLA